MMTVKDVSRLTGVSIRTLQYYDRIQLLQPAAYTESGYRLYDETSLEKLQQILLFRELEFPLRDIREIVNRSDFNREKALDQQIRLLKLKKKHIENLIELAYTIKKKEVTNLDFSAFNTEKLEEYAAKAKADWGDTPEYREFEKKEQNRSPEQYQYLLQEMMNLFAEFGTLKDRPSDSVEVQNQVKQLQDFISEHFYTCSNEILSGLGKMYGSGGEFTENINKAAGDGTAEFVSEAINIYCGK